MKRWPMSKDLKEIAMLISEELAFQTDRTECCKDPKAGTHREIC